MNSEKIKLILVWEINFVHAKFTLPLDKLYISWHSSDILSKYFTVILKGYWSYLSYSPGKIIIFSLFQGLNACVSFNCSRKTPLRQYLQAMKKYLLLIERCRGCQKCSRRSIKPEKKWNWIHNFDISVPSAVELMNSSQ